MLVGKTNSVRGRILSILFATAGVTLAGVALAAAGAAVGAWAWPPQPSSPLGVFCGVVGGLIVIFEMLILPRKWFRGQRLGRTRTWLQWHVWMGLICLPVILVHAGFGFGGPLTTVTLVLFLLVTASGVWGLIMQQWLPQKLLEEIPGETIASQIDRMGDYHADEAARLVSALVTVPPEAESAEPVVSGPLAAELVAFRDDLLLPYLHSGDRSNSPLATPTDAEQRFARLREAVPGAAQQTLDRLQELAELRRRWDTQTRINFWLHNWLLLHLPLSVGMSSLMVLHAVRAMKFW
ncbi:hypothetical protein [Frigoriglobus tundricola]|uniref:Uncharacterized protein n=1 Tax=Frigoriglobus tundricola TaxID=2774151 RepID=A0A6M5YI90_9BACT|nr:hypothetical protein [Frigoriglobus tundricola]QJW93041.1 hypothetical protein FTUN_0541 [Frigoriglobus tundricola]